MEPYKKVMWISTGVAALATLLLIVYFFFLQGNSSPEPVGKPGDPQQETVLGPQGESGPVEEEETAPPLPPLDIALNESDKPVKALIRNCSNHPVLSGWLDKGELVRRFAAGVTNIADGDSPAPHLDFLIPLEKFSVMKYKGKLTVNPESYRRYDLAAAVFSSLESEKLVTLYHRAQPLLNEALKELGYPDKKFDTVFRRAIEHLQAVPAIKGRIELREKVTTYAYLDPALEKLSNAQKHLLRMGPGNIAKIKEKLLEIAALLDGGTTTPR